MLNWLKGKQHSAACGTAARLQRASSPLLMQLEPRIMFDGAMAVTAAEAVHVSDTHAAPDATHAIADKATQNIGPAAMPAPPAADTGRHDVLFVDSRVANADQLLQGAAPGTEIVYLSAQQNGLQQIASYLDQHQGASSVQIIAHGNDGELWLGNCYLSADNVQAHRAVLAEIGKDMNVGGDILIYSCYTAEGERGLKFVDSLSELTGRDVAASTNRTGAGGDWDLEIATGSIESANVLSAKAMAEYEGGLASWTATNNLDSGVGSLRTALSSAQNGDIVTFSGSMTVALNTQLVITKNITVDGDLNDDGAADVILSGQYKTRVVQVNAGVTATFDGLIIKQGMVAGQGAAGGTDGAGALGGGIYNAGNLTLRDVSITANATSGGGGGGGVVAPYVGGAVGGGGGGGGALSGQLGGHGGSAGFGTGVYAGTAGTAGRGGNGGSYNSNYMGGSGGTTTGGAGGIGASNYSNGGNGATAISGSLSIGGGGGGSGWDRPGRAGASAAGGIYNASSGTLTIVGASVISNNIAAGGGGGGGGGLGGSADPGGPGGKGVGAIWNKGTLLMTAANFTAMSGNVGATGAGGQASGGGSTGAAPAAVTNIFNDGGVLNTNYQPDTTPPTVSNIVVATNSLNSGGTSLVTITFSEAVTGFDNADLTVSQGTLSAIGSSNGGVTWTATLTAASNVEAPTNSITLTTSGVQDLAGNAGTGVGISNNYAVHDTVAPTATIVVADNALSVGETSLLTITFSEAVTGFTNADLTIANGTLSAVASSNGGITWTATLTPTANTTDTTNIVAIDKSGVQDASGNAGVGITNSNNYAIDTQRATESIVVADNALSIGETSLVTITFSEAVSGFTNADLTIANGTLTAVSSGDGGITWTATFTPSASINDTTNLITVDNTGVSDLGGNAGSGSTDSNNYVIDTVRPTATIVVADNALKIGETSVVTLTFSEAVTGFTNADLTIANGTLGAVSSTDGGVTWTATFTPTAGITDTTNLITLNNTGVSDPSGNAGSGTTDSNNYVIDTVRPTATIVVVDNALKIGETSLVTVTFSEAVTGFTNADLTIANGTLGAVSSSDGGITWTATVTPTASITDTSNVITLDNTGVSDLSGNAGSGSTNSNNYAIDTRRPTATIVVTDTALKIGESSLVTVTFSEAATGFTNADLTIANGTLSAVSSSDGGITWTATFTPTASITDTTNLITLDNTGVADLAGNAGTGSTDSNNYVIDTLRPTATIVLADPTLTEGETSLVTITFSEAVSGFTNADLTIANGILGAVSSSDGGITWTATFTPTAAVHDSTNVITLANTGVTDLSGNTGSGNTNSGNYTIDTVLPTATIVVADNALKVGDTSVVTITFSEAVSGFSNADLTIDNGTLSAVSSSDGGITWTATLTPASAVTDTSNVITLDGSGVQNVSGNAGSGTTDSNNYAIDTVRPTATIVVTDTALKIGETSLVTVTFSEAATGFTNADLTIANGTLSAVSSSDGGITWTATFTPTASITDPTNLITLDNTGVADLAGNAGTGTSDSSNYAIDSERPTATIVLTDTSLKPGETSLVTITFSEAVTGFSNADLTIANGTLSAVSSSDGDITWTGTFTPAAGITNAANVITLDNSGISDVAGNVGAGSSSSANYVVETEVPTATIVVAENVLEAGETSLVTITFSAAVSGFTKADLTVANGTLSNVASDDGGISWTATFTPTASVTDTTNVISLDNSGVINASGNSGVGLTDSNNYAIETTRPGVASVSVPANGTYVAGQNLDFTVDFGEPVIVDSTGGTPRIEVTLDNGGTVYASYLSGSGSAALVFRLTVANGQVDANGISLGGAIDTNGGNVRDAAGNNAIVNLNNVGSTSGVLVDAQPIGTDPVAPTILVVHSENLAVPATYSAPSVAVTAAAASVSESLPSIFDLQTDLPRELSSRGLAAPPSMFSIELGANRDLDVSLPWRPTEFANWTVVELRSSDGSQVPAWLHYDLTDGTLQGTPPPGFHGVLQIQLVVTDSHGQRVIGTMQLHINDVAQHGGADKPIKPPAKRAATKPGLDAQFARYVRSTTLDADAEKILRQVHIRPPGRLTTSNHAPT